MRDCDAPAQERTRRGSAKRHDQFRRDELDLGIEPSRTGIDFLGGRSLVQSALAARLELEMLHGVGDVGARTFNSSLRKRPIEELPSGPHERSPDQVFLIARLLADE